MGSGYCNPNYLSILLLYGTLFCGYGAHETSSCRPGICEMNPQQKHPSLLLREVVIEEQDGLDGADTGLRKIRYSILN
jgi:hypothetical protein